MYSLNFSVKWTHRYFCCFFTLMYAYIVMCTHTDEIQAAVCTLGMRVCVYVWNVLYVFMFFHCWWWLKHTASYEKEIPLYMCVYVRLCVRVYLPKALPFLVHPYMKIICVVAIVQLPHFRCLSLGTISNDVWCVYAFALKNYDHFVFRENCFSEHDFLCFPLLHRTADMSGISISFVCVYM